jgi:disulfide bond formation protein DsbB
MGARAERTAPQVCAAYRSGDPPSQAFGLPHVRWRAARAKRAFMTGSRLRPAHLLVLLGPSALLGGALAFQHLGGLAPCEMCYWQRWPHLAAIALGLLALALRDRVRRAAVALAGLAVLTSGALGLYHLGVERKWWQGPSACSSGLQSGGDMLSNVLAAPVVRCDVAAWELFGLSMAGWNALLSLAIGGAVLWLIAKH